MPDAILSMVLRCVTASLVLGLSLVGREGHAQRSIVVTARVSANALTQSGPDSGRALLALEVAGLPAIGDMALQRDQVRLVDDAGRTYTAAMVGVSHRGYTLAADSVQSYGDRASRPTYLFWVEPGTTRYALHLPSLPPVRVTASVMGPQQ